MGILDALRKLTGAAGGANPQAGGNPLLQHVLNMINDPSTGGLQGLVDKFKAQGLGGIAASWVGTGQNQPISAQQITQALGSHVQQIAQASGTPASGVAQQLASLLPTVIDKLTPQGQIPAGGALAQGLAMLKNTLGAAAAPPGAPNPTTTPPTRSAP